LVPANYKKVAVVVECDEATQYERLGKRVGKFIPSHVLKSMKERYEEPTFEEGFNSIVKVDSTDSSENYHIYSFRSNKGK
jgi:gluconate kinase